MIESLHFIRPLWLIAIIPTVLYIIWYLFLQGHHSKQNNFVDAQLAKYVLSSEAKQDHFKWPKAILILTAALISIIALSGPSWEKLPQPVIKQQDAMILLLDLSASMNSQDIKPSRLIRAKQKVSDILANRANKQTALIVYAADAYVVTPITDDIKTISTHLPNLDSRSISKQGSRIDRAILKAIDLFEQTNTNKGHILAITDGLEFNSETKQTIKTLTQAGHRLSILGIATSAGGPIPKTSKQGGFITDANSNIVLSKLDRSTLKKAARLGQGSYTDISVNDTDIKRLQKQNLSAGHKNKKTDRISDEWKDMGAYLSILLIPFLLLCFRRSVFFILPLCFLFVSEPSNAYGWKEWFLNKEQRAHKLFQEQQYEAAAENFNSPDWRASSHYKSGKHKESLEHWSTNDSTGLYNKANTLVQQGQLQAAVKNYEESLSLDPNNEDAKHNLELVKKALQEQQQQNSGQNQENQDQQSSKDNQNQQQSEQQNKSDPSSAEQSNDQTGDQTSNQSENKKETSDSQSEKEQNSPEDQTQDSAEEKAKKDLEKSLKEAEAKQSEKQENQATPSDDPVSLEQQEQAILEKQWLERIQDDPSGLLRRKFEYQDYINKQQQESKPW